MTLGRIHHINHLVHDLDQAVARYQRLFNPLQIVREALPGRGAQLARIHVGDSWLVLVQPVAEGVPARLLAARGEGIFLVAYAVDDLDDAAAALRAHGVEMAADGPRPGLANWRVWDLAESETPGVITQLCQEL